MKSIAAVVLALASVGLTYGSTYEFAPDELDDSYAALKEAQGKKDPDLVKKLAIETSTLARELIKSTQPTEASEVENWKARVEFAKQIDVYTEYSLSTAAIESPDKAVDLVDTLLAQNPKSQYLAQCAGAYLAALGKQGADKQLAGANKLAAAAPNSEEVLFVLMNGYSAKNPAMAHTYAIKLIGVLKSKPKPQGVADADWENRKSTMLGTGYFIAGFVEGSDKMQAWADCDRNLRAALPYISKDPGRSAAAYFFLGLANYHLGKMIGDRTKQQDAVKFTDQAAGMKGPYQDLAYRNSTMMKREFGISATKK